WGVRATKPWRRTPMSSSLLSEPSTVKLLARERRPLGANCPAEPTPGPTPGPATEPRVWGGGARPGRGKGSRAKGRMRGVAPSGRVTPSASVKEPERRASVVLISARISFSATVGAGGWGPGAGAGGGGGGGG